LILRTIFVFLVSICSTFFFKKISEILNFFDKPDGSLKVHDKPIPYLGGVALFVSVFLVLTGYAFFYPQLINATVKFFFLVISFFLIGFFDDVFNLTPKNKLVLQAFAGLLFIYLFGGFLFSLLQIFLLLFFILSVVNAFNLIDVSDGLLSSTCLPFFFVMMGYACFYQLFFILYLSKIIFFAVLGFLCFNWQPAKIYLGDAGSLFLASTSLFLIFSVFLTPENFFNTLFLATLFFGIPLAETFSLIIIRSYYRLPIYRGSPHHFAIYLKQQGLTAAQVALFAGVVSAGLSGVAALVIFNIISVIKTLFLLIPAFLLWSYLIYSPARPITKILIFFRQRK